MPSFMPKILIENQTGEKIKVYGPQYEEGLGDSLENFDDFSIVRTFIHPMAYLNDEKETYLGFWWRYFSSKETIEWRISWFYNNSIKTNLSRDLSRATFYIDEKGDYCYLKLILTTEGIEVIRL